MHAFGDQLVNYRLKKFLKTKLHLSSTINYSYRKMKALQAPMICDPTQMLEDWITVFTANTNSRQSSFKT